MVIQKQLLDRIEQNDPSLIFIELSRARPALTVEDLQTLMAALKQNTYVHRLIFCESGLGDDQALTIANALAQLPNITSLDVSVNDISDLGATALFSTTAIEELDITSNQLSEESLTKLLTNNTLQEVYFDKRKIDARLLEAVEQKLEKNKIDANERTLRLRQKLI